MKTEMRDFNVEKDIRYYESSVKQKGSFSTQQLEASAELVREEIKQLTQELETRKHIKSLLTKYDQVSLHVNQLERTPVIQA